VNESGRLVLRELRDRGEFNESVDVAKAAWRFTERALSPAADLIAATHCGGLTAGAFQGKKMLGFVHGFPRTNQGQPCQHSHLLAVRPEAQGRGLSILLKLFQRSWCLERNIRLVTWTYDPFLVKNARLNLVRLRATARAYLRNFYGFMGGIYGELPTDRFEVAWRLDDPLVERAARGEEALHLGETNVPRATSRRIPAAPRVALPFPAGAPRLYRSDPAGALRARRLFGRTATALFERGYEATGIVVRDDGPLYLFDRI
jgi:predicted GNAT superfamily acetyltransferase